MIAIGRGRSPSTSFVLSLSLLSLNPPHICLRCSLWLFSEKDLLPPSPPGQPQEPSPPTSSPDAMDDPSVATAASPILSNASSSSSAPEIHTSTQVYIASSVVTSPSVDSALLQSASPRENASFEVPASSSTQSPDADRQILDALMEALKSKERIFVLRLGELMESLINERR